MPSGETTTLDGSSIRRVRRSLGFTQNALADLLGVHAITVSRWERDLGHPTAWCGGLILQLATIREPESIGRLARARLASDGVPRALYELLQHTDAGRRLETLEAIL